MAPISEREIRLLAIAWGQCADAQPKIDYAKLAGLTGYGSAGSATTGYNRARKAFFASGEIDGDASSSAASATPKTPKSGKKRSADAGDAPDDETAGSKKKRGRKSKAELAAAAAAAVDADQDDEDGLVAKAGVKTDSGNGDSVKAEKTSDTEE